MSKHVVSVSLGSSTRDKAVTIELGGHEIRAERRGVDGDLAAFNRLMRELDGTVDVLSVGGTEIAFHIDDEWLAGTGASLLITTTPRFDGRSFGTKLTEAIITAAVGSDRRLTNDEMNAAIDDRASGPTSRGSDRTTGGTSRSTWPVGSPSSAPGGAGPKALGAMHPAV